MEKQEIIEILRGLKCYSNDMKKEHEKYGRDDEMYVIYEREALALENAIKILEETL